MQWFLISVSILVMIVVTAVNFGVMEWLLERFPGTLTRTYVGLMTVWFLVVFVFYGGGTALFLRREGNALDVLIHDPDKMPAENTVLAEVWRTASHMSDIDSEREMRTNPFLEQYERRLEPGVKALGNNETLMVYLGLAGTLIALVMGMSDTDTNITESAQEAQKFVLSALSSIGFALSTTAVGVFASIAIKLMRDNYEAKIDELSVNCGVLLERKLLHLHTCQKESE